MHIEAALSLPHIDYKVKDAIEIPDYKSLFDKHTFPFPKCEGNITILILKFLTYL